MPSRLARLRRKRWCTHSAITSAPAGSADEEPLVPGGNLARMDTSPSAGAFDRAAALGRLAAEELDVLVIGGGGTRAGVAPDAATRGLRTGPVERGDFAAGAASESA